MLKLELATAAARSLDTLPSKQYRQITRNIIGLMADPFPPDSKALRGHPFRATSAGEYRIVYDIVPGALRVLVIGKRNDDEVYRRLG